MKRSNVIGILAAAAVIVLSVVLISWYLTKRTPMLIQGTVECTTYKASSKVPGRIDDMKVAQGDRVEKGQLLYTLSTPELEAKLRQAEAVKSAAAALDAMALAGARVQQIEAAMNMWQKAQAGLELARKTFERVQNLYNDGVVPAQKLDEASANYKAMEATALAAKAQYDLAVDGASKEEMQERIIIQKWIANFHLGNEAWADFRRTGFPHLIPAMESAVGNNSQGIRNLTLGARRMSYPADEATNNPENYAKAVEMLGGSDNMATRMWWDCNPAVK